MGQTVEPIRLTVPAQADFVSVLRVASRALAGRAGRRDDARTRLQAAVGTAFFAIVEGAPADSSVVAVLSPGPERVELTLLVDPAGTPLDPAHVANLGVEHELSPDGRSLRLWVSDDAAPPTAPPSPPS